MNTSPKRFSALCGIAGFSPEESQHAWRTLNENVIHDFLRWLITEHTWTDEALRSLENVFTAVLEEKTEGTHIVELVLPLFPREDDQHAIVDRFADLFVENLHNFCSHLTQNFTMAQKQVFHAYMKNGQ